ncbi:DNA cytosine methyltransferase [Chromobacterium sp. S0633]|uniref:DNA cytosine methyltransferase n=1 Tax=Chromobacterium sp. S0633 TaxID=2957805 RepID=UPI0020A0A4F1|nr:DNA cytosine methyltransferase [Chromobacterium sp. S0633]MCP1290901.1 DNA cytosine methyltransferase [Chromobacterium sp. S0633]
MIRDQFLLGMDNEIIVDLFAGGGGMSTAIEQALGRHSDVSVNHDEDAVSMHTANHPQTEHYRADVFEVCPYEATRGRAIGLLHLSPDCTHHSQAAGGQPRDRKIRALAWVGLRWAGMGKRRAPGRQPRVITLENVKQILQWGRLIAKRCKHTGRVMKLDGTVAAKGERVPVQEQYLVPDPKHAGRTWRRYVRELEALGHKVAWTTMISADHGDSTTRDRLALVTVWIRGEPWVIVDICLRMLTPRELYGCQGFPASYIIDRGHDGRVFSKSAQVRMVGNSVSPGPARALIWANCSDMAAWTLAELKQRERVAA